LPEAYQSQPSLALPEPVQTQTGRYTYVPATPTLEQLNPLLTVIDVQLPPNVNTVRDSAQYLLQFSGYHFSTTITPNPKVQALVRQIIPEVHRHFANVILRDALLALAGNGYRLLVDPVGRVVAYDLDPSYPPGVAQ
jgi:type IV pili sensor histidine kinase/response regulator